MIDLVGLIPIVVVVPSWSHSFIRCWLSIHLSLIFPKDFPFSSPFFYFCLCWIWHSLSASILHAATLRICTNLYPANDFIMLKICTVENFSTFKRCLWQFLVLYCSIFCKLFDLGLVNWGFYFRFPSVLLSDYQTHFYFGDNT